MKALDHSEKVAQVHETDITTQRRGLIGGILVVASNAANLCPVSFAKDVFQLDTGLKWRDALNDALNEGKNVYAVPPDVYNSLSLA